MPPEPAHSPAVPFEVRERFVASEGHHPSVVPPDFHAGLVDDAWFYRVMNGALEALLSSRRAIVLGHSTGARTGRAR